MIKNPSCGMLIKRIHDTLEKNANNNLRQQDLTMSQAVTLWKLNRFKDKEASLKELEKIMYVAQSTTAGIIVRLEQKGLVETFNIPSDKRIKMVKLTASGEHICQSGEQFMAKAEAGLLAGLTDNEKNLLQNLLQKVNDTLK